MLTSLELKIEISHTIISCNRVRLNVRIGRVSEPEEAGTGSVHYSDLARFTPGNPLPGAPGNIPCRKQADPASGGKER